MATKKRLGKKRVTAKVAGKRMCCTRLKGKKTYLCTPKPKGKKCRKARRRAKR